MKSELNYQFHYCGTAPPLPPSLITNPTSTSSYLHLNDNQHTSSPVFMERHPNPLITPHPQPPRPPKLNALKLAVLAL